MRRKSQVAVFVIVGLLIVVFVSILISVKNISLGRESADAKLFSANRDRLQRFLDECTENAAVRSNVAYGMNKQSRQEYESYFENELHTCMQNLVSTFEEQALVIGLGAPSAETQINEDNIVFSINYPISIEANGKKESRENFRFEVPTEIGHIHSAIGEFIDMEK